MGSNQLATLALVVGTAGLAYAVFTPGARSSSSDPAVALAGEAVAGLKERLSALEVRLEEVGQSVAMRPARRALPATGDAGASEELFARLNALELRFHDIEALAAVRPTISDDDLEQNRADWLALATTGSEPEIRMDAIQALRDRRFNNDAEVVATFKQLAEEDGDPSVRDLAGLAAYGTPGEVVGLPAQPASAPPPTDAERVERWAAENPPAPPAPGENEARRP